MAFIGQLNDSIAEYLDFLVDPGRQSEVLAAFSRFVMDDLKSTWDLLYFANIREDSPFFEGLKPGLAASGGRPRTIHRRPAPYVRLPASWTELLGAKSRNFRKKFRNPLNRINRHYASVELHTSGKDVASDDAMNVLIALNAERWGDEARSFATAKFRDFHRKLARVFAERGWLSLFSSNQKGADSRYDP